MATKSKTFRIDEALAEQFEAWCERRGAVQERVIEALMLLAEKMDADGYVGMMGSQTPPSTPPPAAE